MFRRKMSILLSVVSAWLWLVAMVSTLHASPQDGTPPADALTPSTITTDDAAKAQRAAAAEADRMRMLAQRITGNQGASIGSDAAEPSNSTLVSADKPPVTAAPIAAKSPVAATAPRDLAPISPVDSTLLKAAVESHVTLPRHPNERLPLGAASKRVANQPAANATSTGLPGSENSGDSATIRPSGGGWVLQTITALGVVITLIFITRAIYARVTGRPIGTRNSAVVEVLSRVSVAPRNHVLLLRLGGRVLVVGDSTGGMRTLTEITDPQEVADLLTAVSAGKPESSTAGFGQLLQMFNRKAADPNLGELETDRVQPGDPAFRIDSARDQVNGLLTRVRSLTRLGTTPPAPGPGAWRVEG